MRITGLRLLNFRNHGNSSVEFGSNINVLLGRNGQGKTNIIEALAFLSLTRSFYAAPDSRVVRIGNDRFEVDGDILCDAGGTQKVKVAYAAGAGEKLYTVNNVRPESLASIIGRFPVVLLSPEKNAVTAGGPPERRKFLDMVLSQMYAAYFAQLLEYRRALKQRNAALHDGQGSVRHGAVEPWEEALAAYGSKLILRRSCFLREFAPYVTAAYGAIAGAEEQPSLLYHTVSGTEGLENVEDIAACIRELFAGRRNEEYRRRMTLVGPHRDDVRLELNGLSVQNYASQGQHKTLLVAMKVAEFRYMRERLEETPVLLLDDVFSELDEERSKRLLGLVSTLGQTVITATEDTEFRGALPWGDSHRRFYVEGGTVRAA